MFLKKIKSEKGSALILVIIAVAVLGVAVAFTTSSTIRGYKEKKSTLSYERADYVANACAECTYSYLNKLINTSYTYLLYNASDDYADDYKALNGVEYPKDVRENCPFNKDNSDDFDGIIIKFSPMNLYYNGEDPASMAMRKPQVTDSKYFEYEYYEDGTASYTGAELADFESALEQWKDAMVKYSTIVYDEYMSGKYEGTDESVYGPTIESELNLVVEGIQEGIEDEGFELAEPIKAVIVEDPTNPSKTADDFIKNDYFKIKFIVKFKNGQKTEQVVEYRWDVHEKLKDACKAFAAGAYYEKDVEVEMITNR